MDSLALGQLREAHVALLTAAIPVLRESIDRGEAERHIVHRVVPQDHPVGVQQADGTQSWLPDRVGYDDWYEPRVRVDKLLRSAWDRLSELAEFEDLRDVMQALLESSPHVTDPGEDDRFTTYTRDFLRMVIRGGPGSVDPDRATFDRCFSPVMQYLEEGVITKHGFAPLVHYQGEHDQFHVAGGLRMERISQDQCETLFFYSHGAMGTNWAPSTMVWNTRWVIAWTEPTAGQRSSPRHMAGLFPLALAAFKAGQFHVPIAVEEQAGWYPVSHGVLIAPLPSTPYHYFRFPAEPYRVGADDVAAFTDFWNEFRTIDNARLRLASERLWRAVVAEREQDKIVELVIGLEALYDVGGHELAFRLAGRAAAALGRTAEQRIRVFHQTKKAYEYRSAVVHGRPELPKAEEMCENAERVLRESIALWVRDKGLMENPKALDDRLVQGS